MARYFKVLIAYSRAYLITIDFGITLRRTPSRLEIKIMRSSLSLTEEEVRRYLDVVGESPNVDFKGPMAWDGARTSAELAKDIVALSNTRGGGALVIGVRELAAGEFDRCGVTQEQADTFDTTKVASWLNTRFDPPVRLGCFRTHDNDGVLFIVIVVSEFNELPAMCVKAFQDSENKNKPILRVGDIYIRTENSESAPIRKTDDLRQLISLATTKKHDELLQSISSLLAGTAQTPATMSEPYADDLSEMQESMRRLLGTYLDMGSWSVLCFPSEYKADRWTQGRELARILDENLPPAGLFIVPAKIGERCALAVVGPQAAAISLSGLVHVHEAFVEDTREFKNPRVGGQSLPPQEWMEYRQAIWRAERQFMFLGRIAHEFDADEELVCVARAIGIANRHLVSETPLVNTGVGLGDPCVAAQFTWRKIMTAAELRGGWQEFCADALVDFFDRFRPGAISRDVIRQWVKDAP